MVNGSSDSTINITDINIDRIDIDSTLIDIYTEGFLLCDKFIFNNSYTRNVLTIRSSLNSQPNITLSNFVFSSITSAFSPLSSLIQLY